jgi:hypothetical protein
VPRLIRHPTTLIAPVAVLAAALCLAQGAHAAPGDLPDLVQGRPANVTGGYFDDHSIAGDDHLEWGHGASQNEPLAVDFTATLANAGPGALEVCGYPSGTAGWMRAFQAAPGALAATCPAAPPPDQLGWFRYATANHSSTGLFNRWHLADLQRFALVPLPHSFGGPRSAATAWDTDWGTCLNLGDPSLFCSNDAGAASLDVGIAPGATKVTQDGAPDDQRIAIPTDKRASFPDGAYQIVAISNPYGLLSEAGNATGSVACTTVTLANAPNYGGFTATALPAVPAHCYVPRTLPAALTGPGGRDPMANAAPTTPPCPLDAASGHCWVTPPPSGPYPPARSDLYAYAAATIVPTDAVRVAQGAHFRANPAPAQAHARSAVRRTFGRGLKKERVSCRLTQRGRGSSCTVGWRQRGASYRGRVFVRLRTVHHRLRWQYRVDVRKRLHGRTTHIRRAYRTGGLA